MNKVLENAGKVFLAIVLCVATSTVARAVWDSTTGNMPNSYQLCWGLAKNACVYGSTVSNFVRIQTGGTDALTIDSSQLVTVPGSFAVTGNASVTGNVSVTGTTAFTGAVTLPSSTVTTAKIASNAVTTPKLLLADQTASSVACITTYKTIGTCSKVVADTGVCDNCL